MGTNDWITPTTLHDPDLTPAIRLVPLHVSHATDLHAAADPELFLHGRQNPPEWSVKGFERDIEKVNSTSGGVAFAIVLAAPAHSPSTRKSYPAGIAIGRTTFMDIRPEHRGVEIGRTWIARAFHGTRVNPESKYLLLCHAFENITPGAVRVQITTSGTNLHSQRAIEKLGAVKEGILRHARILPPFPPPHEAARPKEVWCDWIHYSIVSEEWFAAGGVRERLESRLKRLASLRAP